MDHFLYREGQLMAEDVAIADIAAQVGTPFYVYSSATLLRHFNLLDDALEGMDHLICFAMKSCSNLAVLKLLGDAGAGMDVVSIGEYLRAKAAGRAVDLFLSRDALAPGALAFMSDRAARRLCDRLVALGAVRELTGRDTFRLYGV